MVRIIAIVRARNEARHIGLHCKHHDFADKILVADGGSEDNTIEIAEQFPNVTVRDFPIVDILPGGYKRNPDYKHINFLIAWAEEEGADWIVMDDCDTNPNYLLREEAREIMEHAEHPYVLAVQIALWGKTQYFPKLSKPGGGDWQGGIWAWKAEKKLRTYGDPPHFMFKSIVESDANVMVDFSKEPHVDLFPPYCRIHAVWENKELVGSHIEMYRESNLIAGMQPPEAWAGSPALLDEWIRYGE
jgi:glycosyltransferase involved in cell wall biosynthesis